MLKDVLMNGSKADISTVGNEILTAKLSALQVEVDKAQALKADLETKILLTMTNTTNIWQLNQT